MKWMYHIKYKIRAVAGLACIILVILAGNLVVRERFSKLDRSVASICNDRLKPSVYIYEISNNLYQKRLLLKECVPHAQTVSYIDHHNRTIASLIRSYEKTFLTSEEKKQWSEFKKHLNSYNLLEKELIGKNTGAILTSPALETEFNFTLKTLDHLSQIQIGEGNQLQQASKSIINSSIALSSFEMVLLIVLGLFTLVILSVSDRSIFSNYQKQVLN